MDTHYNTSTFRAWWIGPPWHTRSNCGAERPIPSAVFSCRPQLQPVEQFNTEETLPDTESLPLHRLWLATG